MRARIAPNSERRRWLVLAVTVAASRQIGGSIGLAAVTTIAATATSHYARNHAVPAFSSPALTHGRPVERRER